VLVLGLRCTTSFYNVDFLDGNSSSIGCEGHVTETKKGQSETRISCEGGLSEELRKRHFSRILLELLYRSRDRRDGVIWGGCLNLPNRAEFSTKVTIRTERRTNAAVPNPIQIELILSVKSVVVFIRKSI
jgi:hypothetical protein